MKKERCFFYDGRFSAFSLFHLVKVLFYFFDTTKELEIGGNPQCGSCRLCDMFVCIYLEAVDSSLYRAAE